MLSSTVSPRRAATAGTYARARASPGARAGCVTSSPKSSTVPDDARNVPADDVEQRRLPGAVRAEDRAALAVDDVEIDVVARRASPRNAGRPPASGGSARRARRTVLLRSPTYLMNWFVMMPFLTTWILPCQGSFRFTQGGKFRPGAGLFGPNKPPNVWSTFGT